MNLIIPMAGMGKRLRPHTLTTPKPLVHIAGKPIVERLVLDISKVCEQPLKEIAFIIGDFGKDIEESLLAIAKKLGAKGHIVHQKEALGTAHAIYCAKELLKGNIIVAFADTLFKANFKLNANSDGIIWVKQVEDPSAFGVVKLNEHHVITDFVEKPKEFVSDLAIIGIYYFKEGEKLREEIQYLIDSKITSGGEYQLTVALENLKAKGTKFIPGEVQDWLDCGNKKATVNTNKVYLSYLEEGELISKSSKVINSIIIPPVYLGDGAVLENSIVGPGVSVGENTKIDDSIVKNTIIGNHTEVKHAVIKNSMIGKNVKLKHAHADLSIGDFNEIEQ